MKIGVVLILVVLGLMGCSNEAEQPGDTDVGSSTDVHSDTELRSDADGGDEPTGPSGVGQGCEGLFGRPGENTGLDEEMCSPSCECEDGIWEAPDYDDEVIAELRRWSLVEELVVPEVDPYKEGDVPDREGYCGVVVVDDAEKTYRLETFSTLEDLTDAGARLTHGGRCGLCSTLQDLAVYMESMDLTGPVRQCGVQGLVHGEEEQRECIAELGYSEGCTQIWSWNTSHTGEVCRSICMPLLSAPYNNEDGSINDCLACDEEESGPIFQAVAGRTRRNSGIPSAICRPCDGVYRIVHAW